MDAKRSLCARASAAKALGRAQLSPAVDMNVIAVAIADLSRQIVETRNAKKQPVRRWCIMNVYLAFRPRDANEKSHHAGLLDRVEEAVYQKYKKSITEVY